MPARQLNKRIFKGIAAFTMPLLLYGCLKSPGPLLPAKVVEVIRKTAVNRTELVKAIGHYNQTDSLKLQASYFLIGNMLNQYSVEYQLVDRYSIAFRFEVADLSDSIPVEESWKQFSKKNNGLTFKAKKYTYDRDSLQASYLIQHIELATESRKNPWASDIPDSVFFENVLPYRIGNEMPDNWRHYLSEYFAPLIPDSIRSSRNSVAQFVNNTINRLIHCDIRYNLQPDLRSPTLLLQQAAGSQEEISYLKVKALRSLGIPAALDYIPYLADSVHSYFFPVFYTENHSYQPLGESDDRGDFPQNQHIPKVFRRTFQELKTGLFAQKIKEQPSPPFLGHYHQLDVTHQYVPVKTLQYQVACNDSFVYLCVSNGNQWKAIDWARVENDRAVFANIGPVAHLRVAQMKGDSLALLPDAFLMKPSSSGFGGLLD